MLKAYYNWGDMILHATGNWVLKHGDEVLGHLIYEATDQPFFFYKFHSELAYNSVQRLFEEEIRLMDKGDEEWIEASMRIDRLGLTLISMIDQTEVDDFLLHIDGQSAWLRLL